MITCKRCGNQSPQDAIFCDQCGARLAEQTAATTPDTQAEPAVVAPTPVAPEPLAATVPEPVLAAQPDLCPSCGASVTPGEMFCSECGTRLEAPAPETVSIPVQATVPEIPESAPDEDKALCPFCGADTTPGETFCYACGAQLSTQPVQTTASTPAPVLETPQTAEATPAQPVAEPVAAPTSVPATPPVCAACGAQIPEGQAFCPFCGAAVVGAATEAFTTTTPAQSISSARLVVTANNTELAIPAGSEVVVGREDPYSGIYPDVDLTPHGGEEGGVSRRHFKIYGAGNQYTIEDLNSTNLTLLNQTRLQPGVRTPLNDGDEIRAGRVRLVFRIN